MRSSTVPYVGCGRMSHHTSLMEAMVWVWMSVSMYRSKPSQPSTCCGRPAVGSPSNTLLREDARPVSPPTQ